MVIKPFLLFGLAAEYRSWWWVWSTIVRRPSDVYDTHQQLGWQHLRRSAVPGIWLVPTKI